MKLKWAGSFSLSVDLVKTLDSVAISAVISTGKKFFFCFNPCPESQMDSTVLTERRMFSPGFDLALRPVFSPDWDRL